MINEIVDLINDGFDGIHAQETVLGLVQRVYRSTAESIEFMPGIVKPDGEVVYAGIDDINSLMIYHKTNNATLSFVPRSGYGDARVSEDVIFSSIIAVWDTRKIQLQSVDMLLLLRSRMPQFIKGVKEILQVQIVPSGAVLNTKQVFESEYTFGENYLLPVYINFIQLNYTIAIKYDQQCIDKCINCKF